MREPEAVFNIFDYDVVFNEKQMKPCADLIQTIKYEGNRRRGKRGRSARSSGITGENERKAGKTP